MLHFYEIIFINYGKVYFVKKITNIREIFHNQMLSETRVVGPLNDAPNKKRGYTPLCATSERYSHTCPLVF